MGSCNTKIQTEDTPCINDRLILQKPVVVYNPERNRNHAKLLLYGYLRGSMIPDDVIDNILFHLIYHIQKIDYFKLFHAVVAEFSSNTFHRDRMVMMDSSPYAISQHAWTPYSGKHEMVIKILNHSLSSGSFAIGIVTNPIISLQHKNLWLFDSKDAGYSYQLWFPEATLSKPAHIYSYKHGVRNFHQHIDIFKNIIKGHLNLHNDNAMNNAEVKMIIDTNRWNLTFFYDNKHIGQTIMIEPDNTYYAAVAFGGFNWQYKLIFHGYQFLR